MRLRLRTVDRCVPDVRGTRGAVLSHADLSHADLSHAGRAVADSAVAVRSVRRTVVRQHVRWDDGREPSLTQFDPPLPCDVPGRVSGIDISAAQPRLPMDRIVAAGNKWVCMKASEGTWPDHAFATHYADVTAAGLKREAYHFFRSSDPWQPQADEYLRCCDGKDFEMRPSLDWEDQKRILEIGPARALAAALQWLDYVGMRVGRRPNVYTGKGVMDLFRGLDLSPLLGYDLWCASYRFSPTDGHDFRLTAPLMPAPWTEARAWQWGGNGAPRIEGVPFDLDRDVFFGDEAAFDAWCADVRPTPVPSTLPSPEAHPDGSSAHALQIDAQKREPDAG
jgi:lysozyme